MTSLVACVAELQARLSPKRRNPRRFAEFDTVHLDQVPRVRCADGFHMSIQSGYALYCAPRDSEGPWHAVEVGFPSARVETFMPYIDGDQDSDPTGTVYGFVPLEIVAQAILDHGGFADERPAGSAAEGAP